jgi:hypothetical protein
MYGLSQHESTAIYGMTSRARWLAPLAAASDTEVCDRFLVGTLGLREENEIHLVEVDDEDGRPSIFSPALWAHPGEVTALSPSLTDPNLFFTAYNVGSRASRHFLREALPEPPRTGAMAEPRATLWRVPEQLSDGLVEAGTVEKHEGQIMAYAPALPPRTSIHGTHLLAPPRFQCRVEPSQGRRCCRGRCLEHPPLRPRHTSDC